ncbi:hypothetical protein [Actinomadura rupiterrae]|uniref:hypothetical protein n=1 Tax=Actinomadura rupiterrae TaxID=559627 RepID=UPI002646CC42|nr:hypothetical protein [Actinomadura rupiterrae]MCP2335422.1 hypothetical protein [Actinomadura rupiterrae]
MGALVLATGAPAAYVAGFAVFKVAGRRMPRLAGSRPLQTTWNLATSPLWLCGLALLIYGLGLQSYVLTRIPPSLVVPMYGPVMLVLLLISVSNFGERVGMGETRAFLVLVLSLLSLAAAGDMLNGHRPPSGAGPWDATAPLWRVAAVIGPSVLIPLWLFTVRDKAVSGRHAKRVTGVAYGLGAGVVVGCAESSGASIARMLRHDVHDWEAVLRTPHLYVVVVAGLLGAALAHIGLQRCRLSVVIIVLAVGSKASLWLTGILVYGQPFPHGPARFALTGVGLAMAILAVLLIPRHEPEDRDALVATDTVRRAPRRQDGAYSTPLRPQTTPQPPAPEPVVPAAPQPVPTLAAPVPPSVADDPNILFTPPGPISASPPPPGPSIWDVPTDPEPEPKSSRLPRRARSAAAMRDQSRPS